MTEVVKSKSGIVGSNKTERYGAEAKPIGSSTKCHLEIKVEPMRQQGSEGETARYKVTVTEHDIMSNGEANLKSFNRSVRVVLHHTNGKDLGDEIWHLMKKFYYDFDSQKGKNAESKNPIEKVMSGFLRKDKQTYVN